MIVRHPVSCKNTRSEGFIAKATRAKTTTLVTRHKTAENNSIAIAAKQIGDLLGKPHNDILSTNTQSCNKKKTNKR